jgi:hypothetical protein
MDEGRPSSGDSRSSSSYSMHCCRRGDLTHSSTPGRPPSRQQTPDFSRGVPSARAWGKPVGRSSRPCAGPGSRNPRWSLGSVGLGGLSPDHQVVDAVAIENLRNAGDVRTGLIRQGWSAAVSTPTFIAWIALSSTKSSVDLLVIRASLHDRCLDDLYVGRLDG